MSYLKAYISKLKKGKEGKKIISFLSIILTQGLEGNLGGEGVEIHKNPALVYGWSLTSLMDVSLPATWATVNLLPHSFPHPVIAIFFLCQMLCLNFGLKLLHTLGLTLVLVLIHTWITCKKVAFYLKADNHNKNGILHFNFQMSSQSPIHIGVQSTR